MRKYALDTNLYVRAFRSKDFSTELATFYESFAPSCYLSSVVLHELVVGGRSRSRIESVREKTARPFQRTGRVFTHRSGPEMMQRKHWHYWRSDAGWIAAPYRGRLSTTP